MAARVIVMGHQNDKAGQNGAEYKRAGIAPSISFGLDSATRGTLSYYYLKLMIHLILVCLINMTSLKRLLVNRLMLNKGIYYGWKDRDFQKQENQIGTLNLNMTSTIT